MLSPAHRAAGALLGVSCALALLGACSAPPDNSAYCAALKAADAAVEPGGGLARGQGSRHPVRRDRQDRRGHGPAEVRSEWAALQTLFEKFATDRPDLSSVSGEMKVFQDAAKRIEAHARETCGIDLGE